MSAGWWSSSTAQGDIVPGSLDPNVSGAFATTDDAVADLYADGGVDVDHDGDIDAADADPFASGSRGDLVNDIAQGVGSVINQQDGNLFGKTDVYLEGRRGEVRTEETNLGTSPPTRTSGTPSRSTTRVMVSIKNGGGIRDSIGRVEAVGGNVQELPPAANPERRQAGRRRLASSTSPTRLRFNNALCADHADAAAAARGAGARGVGDGTGRHARPVRADRRHRIFVRCDTAGASPQHRQWRRRHPR